MTWAELTIMLLFFLALIIYLVVAAASFSAAGRDYIYVIGHLTAIHLALTLLPATRSSIWVLVFGISLERAIKW